MDIFWKHLVWSFRALYEGKWPSHNADGDLLNDPRAGTWLADGYCGTLWAIKGDLEWFALSLQLENSASLSPCFCCKANTTSHPWTDAHLGAAWEGTVWSNGPWALNRARHILFSLPGVSISTVAPDLMHCKHLGSDAYFSEVVWNYW